MSAAADNRRVLVAETVRGTCLAIEGHGVLLRGRSGAGKSDLALRVIDAGGCLVSDDYTVLRRDLDRLIASAPASIAGLLEVRGLGVLSFPALSDIPLVAAIDLVNPGSEVDRLPEPATLSLLDITLPLFRLAAFEASAAAKVRLAVRLASGGIMST